MACVSWERWRLEIQLFESSIIIKVELASQIKTMKLKRLNNLGKLLHI